MGVYEGPIESNAFRGVPKRQSVFTMGVNESPIHSNGGAQSAQRLSIFLWESMGAHRLQFILTLENLAESKQTPRQVHGPRLG